MPSITWSWNPQVDTGDSAQGARLPCPMTLGTTRQRHRWCSCEEAREQRDNASIPEKKARWASLTRRKSSPTEDGRNPRPQGQHDNLMEIVTVQMVRTKLSAGPTMFCQSISRKDKSRLHEFGTRVLPGKFTGYALHWRWLDRRLAHRGWARLGKTSRPRSM